MQTKQELEEWYAKPDPWGYEDNIHDTERKLRILAVLDTYERALDIGAGEGWITKDLPAKVIEAMEISDTASARFPDTIIKTDKPIGRYDLIVATGVLYRQYDWEHMLSLIKKHASRHILLSHIKDWEVADYSPLGEQIHYEEFPYREYTQALRLIQV